MTDLDVQLTRAGALLDRLADEPPELRHEPHPPRSRWALAVAGAAVLALVAGLWAAARPSTPATTLAAPDVAVSIPEGARVLPTAPGWTMREVQQVTPDRGEVSFGDGTHEATLDWALGTTTSTEHQVGGNRTIAGFPGQLLEQRGDDAQWAMWFDATHVVNFRTFGGFPADLFDEVVDSLRPVDAAAWIAALPPDAHGRDGASVEQVLDMVPLPPGVTTADVRAQVPDVANHYQLTAEATSVVVCGWIRSWIDATAAGRTAVATAAVDAMATSHTWPALVAIADEGGWSDEVWQYADAIHDGTPIIGGRPLTVAESYEDALGCD
jgi:hypothetical protein